MTDLTTFAALQARVYEFLGQQDEATLRAIVDGTARLTIAGAAAAPARSASSSNDPLQAARDLAAMTSEERRTYLETARLTVPGLGKVAKALGITGYSGLPKAKLIDRLIGHDTAPSEPAVVPDSPPPTMPDVDPAAVAARLRETETEAEGADYLREQRLDHGTLLAVATELQLTRVDRLRQTELEKRVLKQAIGARRKFSGLRKW